MTAPAARAARSMRCNKQTANPLRRLASAFAASRSDSAASLGAGLGRNLCRPGTARGLRTRPILHTIAPCPLPVAVRSHHERNRCVCAVLHHRRLRHRHSGWHDRRRRRFADDAGPHPAVRHPSGGRGRHRPPACRRDQDRRQSPAWLERNRRLARRAPAGDRKHSGDGCDHLGPERGRYQRRGRARAGQRRADCGPPPHRACSCVS